MMRCRRYGDCHGGHAAVAVTFHVADDAVEVVAAEDSNCATSDGEEAAPADDARSAGTVAEDHEVAAATARSVVLFVEAGEIAAVEETRSVISLTLDAGGELPTPRLSRLLLHFGALAAADVVSQTLLLKPKMKLLLLRRWSCGRLGKKKMQLLIAARR
jgi:hypothetical protein